MPSPCSSIFLAFLAFEMPIIISYSVIIPTYLHKDKLVHFNTPAAAKRHYCSLATGSPRVHHQQYPTWNWGLGKRAEPADTKDCGIQTTPNKWGTVAAASSPQHGVWGQNQGLGFSSEMGIGPKPRTRCLGSR